MFLVGILLYSLHFFNHRKAKKNSKALAEYKENIQAKIRMIEEAHQKNS
jgi:Ca2+-dependent lipid-binding protein